MVSLQILKVRGKCPRLSLELHLSGFSFSSIHEHHHHEQVMLQEEPKAFGC